MKLNVLAHAGLADDLSATESTFPTWIPDWRRKRGNQHPKYSPVGVLPLYCASGSSKAVFSVSEDRLQLTLRGIFFDTINTTQGDPASTNWDWFQSTLTSLKLDLANYHILDEPMETALVRTVTTDSQYSEGRIVRIEPTRVESYREMARSRAKSSSWPDPSFRAVNAIVKLNTSAKKGMQLGLTNRGILVNLPVAAQPGDIIAVFLGANLPHVLRPCDSGFRLVSECYAHGFMDGEALVEARKAANPNYDGLDRTWLGELDEQEVPFTTREFVLV
jgi:hypothetical protein